MREYSENVAAEFEELVRRADHGGIVRLTLVAPNGDLYTVTGEMCGVQRTTLTLKDAKADLSKLTDKACRECVREMKTGTAHIPLGDFVKNYEILTPPVFDAREERKRYRAYVRERIRNASITDLIWGDF
jgi:hypothetical protein